MALYHLAQPKQAVQALEKATDCEGGAQSSTLQAALSDSRKLLALVEKNKGPLVRALKGTQVCALLTRNARLKRSWHSLSDLFWLQIMAQGGKNVPIEALANKRFILLYAIRSFAFVVRFK